MEVYVPVGTEQIAPTTATAATIPAGANRATISVRGNPCIMTMQGDTPDATTVGHELAAGFLADFTIAEGVTVLTFLDTATGASNVYITYHQVTQV